MEGQAIRRLRQDSQLGSSEAVAESEYASRPVRYALPDPAPLVSILIPTRDRKDLLQKVVEGVRRRTRYPSWEILVVDNQTSDPDTLEYFRSILRDSRVRVLRYDAPFNFSAMVNLAAREAKGSVLALLHNDLEIIKKEWLSELVAIACQNEIGCVGPQLVCPRSRTERAGVNLSIRGVLNQVSGYISKSFALQQGSSQKASTVSFVASAALVVRKSVFDALGGFNERELAGKYHDVDFCLRAQASGLRNVYEPSVVLTHLGSAGRPSKDRAAKDDEFSPEGDFMKDRWGLLLNDEPSFALNHS